VNDPTPQSSLVNHPPFAARLQALAADPRVQVLVAVLAALALLLAVAGDIHITTGPVSIWIGR
jgi:hypothetical protein